MGILAVYDTVGIQDYIFSSNKLAENIGASKLVADIFGETLCEVIVEVTKKPLPDWRNGAALNAKLSAEIIYQGGGNAYVAFRDKDDQKSDNTFQEVTKKFLTRVSKQARGVGIAVAAVETSFGDTYKSDFKKLNKRLALVKGGFNVPVFAGSQPITKQSGRTGLPTIAKVEVKDKDEYLSQSQELKRDRYAAYKKETETYIDDFDDLTFEKGTDSLIAIIHADGNNMGSRIKTFMEQEKFNNYSEAVPNIRKLSTSIDKCYKEARERAIDAFKKKYAEYIADLEKKPSNKELYEAPPLLEFIGDGDDTTLVIGGQFALDFATRLLREIENTPEESRPFTGVTPTACAGVVIFHSHYPFSEAYKLAEALCGNAKKPSRDNDGSYIDFHLHQSGGVSDLSVLREKLYTVDGKSILRRPWRVSAGLEDKLPNFNWFESNCALLSDEERFPRNKVKAIRNAIGAGEKAAKLAENTLRGEKLPKMSVFADEKISEYAPVFDILEMLDVYKNLIDKGDAGNAE
ncbi:hypothetical protein FACS1894187_13680 [Synergistales bacterium]|nr:hypothetical protein FACS1894187_13680 [Synergistales bacterium]